MPRPISVTIVIILLLYCALAVASSTELKLASDIWPPFTDQAGRPRVAIELVQEALIRAGYRGLTDILDFEAVIQGLGMGNYDGSAALWKDAEREKFLLFSEPYLENRLVLVGRKGTDVSAGNFMELAGMKIAVVAGYSYGDITQPDSGPEFVEGRNDQDNLSLLLTGQVDYMLVDELLISHVQSHQQEEAGKHLAIGTTPLARKPLHFALARGLPGAETIIAKFNGKIREMVADGTFNKILGLNWIKADVDGDGRLELVHGGFGAGPEAPASVYAMAGTADDTSGNAVDRFWIEGKMYESWDEVPERYKYNGPGEGKEDPGMTLYKLEF